MRKLFLILCKLNLGNFLCYYNVQFVYGFEDFQSVSLAVDKNFVQRRSSRRD